MTSQDSFGARAVLNTSQGSLSYFRLGRLEEMGAVQLDRLPFSMRIFLENILRNQDGTIVTEEDVLTTAGWKPKDLPNREIPFKPGRVLLQDLTGVPAIVDLASMRSAMHRMGGDPKRINPIVPVDLVIDHSVQVDFFGGADAFERNVTREYERNQERYALLRWAQQAFQNTRIVPPGTGIVHQVNLEYLASVVATGTVNGQKTAFPDTVVGTDSHTTMVNGLGVLGWGVGGIEAEVAMVGQPIYMLLPEVIGVKLTGQLREGVTATDLVLTITEMLRNKGVVEKFVEFYGPGLHQLPLPDRATIANMCPEYGATVGMFPIDDITLAYMRSTGRDPAQVDLTETYAKAQGLFHTENTPEPDYSDTLELDMTTVEASLAGPRRPQDRIALAEMGRSFHSAMNTVYDKPVTGSHGGAHIEMDGQDVQLDHGSIVIAAITSCTNTSNPSVMVGAGLLAKAAVDRGLERKPWIKTSMAPGSRVVTDYLEAAGLTTYLEMLGFYTVGYGCTTCIGNSGPLPDEISAALIEHDLVTAAVVSGNRNFEARIHPDVKANYLASPMLVVAFSLVGRVDVDLVNEPLGTDRNDQPVYLRDIWPSQQEISTTLEAALKPEMYQRQYSEVFKGDERWTGMPVPTGELYAWDPDSTYVQELPIFDDLSTEPQPLNNISDARVLVMLGDSVTTDHISPAGNFAPGSPAGQYLGENGVSPRDFNTYGARRGNHDVMIRGTFANVRLRNQLTPDTEGTWTTHMPDKTEMTIYDAAMRYQEEGVPLLVLAGKELGTGSSRDWAAKGPFLLGVRAVLAESYERIHRSNLIGLGILPLQYMSGESRESLGLTGTETYDIQGITELEPGKIADVSARQEDGTQVQFKALIRIDTPIEVDYYRHGGVLQYVLRQLLAEGRNT